MDHHRPRTTRDYDDMNNYLTNGIRGTHYVRTGLFSFLESTEYKDTLAFFLLCFLPLWDPG